MTQSIFVQDIPDGPFSFSDLTLERVTHHGYTYDRAHVPRDRVADLILGEEIAGRTNFKMDAREGGGEVLPWGTRGVAVGCACGLRETASLHDGCCSGPLHDPSWPLLLPQFEVIIKYECTYGPQHVPPSTVARVPFEEGPEGEAHAARPCGCQYRFAVYYLRREPTLVRVERVLQPHTAHPDKLCRWTSTAGREAVTQAFEDGQRGCHVLRGVLLRSIKERFGVTRGACLTDEDVHRLVNTRPDLARDYLISSQDILCAGVRPCLEGWGVCIRIPSPQ